MSQINEATITRAALEGIRITASANETGGLEIIVSHPTGEAYRFEAVAEAEQHLAAVFSGLQDAREEAERRAREWRQHSRETRHQVTEWNDLAARVNDALPAGCNIPLADKNSPYGIGEYPPMEAMVADALARWKAARRDEAAQGALSQAVEAEGSRIREAAEQPMFRPEFWDTEVQVWRPIHIIEHLPRNPQIEAGRVMVDEGTRREVAWRVFGIAVALGEDAISDAQREMNEARERVEAAAQSRAGEAEALRSRIA